MGYREKCLFVFTLLSSSFFAEFLGINVAYAIDGITPEDVVNCTNEYRREHDLPDFIVNSKLELAAGLKAEDIKKYKYWSHTNPETGKEPWDFFDASRYDYETAGENLAFDFQNAQDACDSLMQSPTHRANILDKNFQEIGVSVEYADISIGSGNLIVQMFGSRADFGKTSFIDKKEYTEEIKNCYNSSLNGLTIIYPDCGVTNQPNPPIEIIVPSESSTLSLILNGREFKGEVLSTNNKRIFTWNSNDSLSEGLNKFVAESGIPDSADKEVALTGVILDRNPPLISEEDIVIKSKEENGQNIFDIIVKIEEDNPGDVYLIYENDTGDSISQKFIPVGEDLYQTKIPFPKKEPEKRHVVIKAYDQANNAGFFKVAIDEGFMGFAETWSEFIIAIISIAVISFTILAVSLYSLENKGVINNKQLKKGLLFVFLILSFAVSVVILFSI